MKYIYALSYLHESNTFSKNISDIAWFKNRCWKFGEEVISRFQGVKTEFGGFIDAISLCNDMKLIPIFAAEATPSGPVSSEVETNIKNTVVEALRKAPQVDAVLLSIHGAMVTETSQDGEGDLAEAIRKTVGPGIPIYATIDLHANITEKMTQYIDIMIPYDLYPHTDKYERGLQTANMLVQHLRGIITPRMLTKKLPLLFPMIPSFSPSLNEVNDAITFFERERGILNVSFTHGFINADIYEAGACVQVIADGSTEKAAGIVDEISQLIWKNRAIYSSEYMTPDEAAASITAYSKKPVVIADGPDNPGCGSYADGTKVLRMLIEKRIPSALVILINDPDSVDRCHAAGEGSSVQLRLGGKHESELLGKPIECVAKVIKLTDGKYRNLGPMNPGLMMDLSGTSLIDISGIKVIIAKKPTQPYDFGILKLHGIEPEKEQIIVVKSSVHFLASYGPIAKKIILLSYPSICAQRPQDVKLLRCRRPIYPLDDETDFK